MIAWFAKGHFTEGIFSTVDFTSGTLWGTKFHTCKMDGIILKKARCSMAEFVDCTPEVVINVKEALTNYLLKREKKGT